MVAGLLTLVADAVVVAEVSKSASSLSTGGGVLRHMENKYD